MYVIDGKHGGTTAVHECCAWRYDPDHDMPALAPDNQRSNTHAFEPFPVDHDYRIKELTVEMCASAAAFNLQMVGEESRRYSRYP